VRESTTPRRQTCNSRTAFVEMISVKVFVRSSREVSGNSKDGLVLIVSCRTDALVVRPSEQSRTLRESAVHLKLPLVRLSLSIYRRLLTLVPNQGREGVNVWTSSEFRPSRELRCFHMWVSKGTTPVMERRCFQLRMKRHETSRLGRG